MKYLLKKIAQLEAEISSYINEFDSNNEDLKDLQKELLNFIEKNHD